MSDYKRLAKEMLENFDHGPVPHRDKVSSAVRGEMAVIRLLERENRVMTAGEISRTLKMTTARIAAVLNSLQKKEMIERYADEADKRRVMVRITPKGMAFCLKRKEEAVEHMAKILECLGQEDAGTLVRLMKRIHEILPQVGPPHEHDQEGRSFTDHHSEKGEADE